MPLRPMTTGLWDSKFTLWGDWVIGCLLKNVASRYLII